MTGGTRKVGPSSFGINEDHEGRSEEEDRTVARVRARQWCESSSRGDVGLSLSGCRVWGGLRHPVWTRGVKMPTNVHPALTARQRLS